MTLARHLTSLGLNLPYLENEDLSSLRHKYDNVCKALANVPATHTV